MCKSRGPLVLRSRSIATPALNPRHPTAIAIASIKGLAVLFPVEIQPGVEILWPKKKGFPVVSRLDLSGAR
jgi:hypothetical protein